MVLIISEAAIIKFSMSSPLFVVAIIVYYCGVRLIFSGDICFPCSIFPNQVDGKVNDKQDIYSRCDNFKNFTHNVLLV